MRVTLKRLAKMTAGYSLVSLLGPVFTILLTPLYTRVLAPADYGVVDVALTLSSFLIALGLMGMDGALNVYFFDSDVAHQRNLVTTATLFAGGLGLALGMALFAIGGPLALFLFKDITQRNLIYMLAISIVCVPVYNVILAGLRLQMSVTRVNILGLVGLVSTVLFNLVLVLLLDWKATGVIAANMLVNVTAFGLALWLAHRSLRGRIRLSLLGPLARVGFGLLPGSISFLLLANVDRLMLTQFVSQTDIGLYSIANKLASMLWVIIGPAWSAWWPLALEMAQKPGAPSQYARIYEYFMAGSMWLALGIGLFAPQILEVFTRSAYVPAAPFALLLLACVGPLGLSAYFFQISLYIRKLTPMISLAYVVSAGVNIALNLWLMPRLGVWGAVLATILAALPLMTIMYSAGQRALFVPYRWGRVSAIGGTYLGLVLAFLFVPSLNSFFLKIVALLAFALAVPLYGIVTGDQIRTTFGAVRHRIAHLTHAG
jgi:O-antigen/teichoic acid export membrane protein